jgi:ABC-2 type transport system ATP-binding protein
VTASEVEVVDLVKRYGRATVVDSVSFACSAGTVTGLLGPNGAGKTTTLRMLVGLVRPTRGRALVSQRRYADLPTPGRLVGAVIDASTLHPGRSVVETVRLAALACSVPLARAEERLTLVGLSGAERKFVKHLSLGMRQRLALAVALIGEPRVLILDEPINGLDPAGIAWFRTLVGDFAANGGCALISSHLLGELGEIADTFVGMRAGKVVDRFDAASGGPRTVLIETPEPVMVMDVLVRAGIRAEVTGERITTHSERATIEDLVLRARVPVFGYPRGERWAVEQRYLAAVGERAVPAQLQDQARLAAERLSS